MEMTFMEPMIFPFSPSEKLSSSISSAASEPAKSVVITTPAKPPGISSLFEKNCRVGYVLLRICWHTELAYPKAKLSITSFFFSSSFASAYAFSKFTRVM